MENKCENERKLEIQRELQVMKKEGEFILQVEVPAVCKNLGNYIHAILKYLTGADQASQISQAEKVILTSPNMEGLKCSLTIQHNELKNIEINYKPTPRHNNYIYKSREDASWTLYQITNSSDILKSVQMHLDNISAENSIGQIVLNIDRILDSLNSARNILLFPKKRSVAELQSQKNMKIFPLVPNDLVFSFYIQGFKLLLAIYLLKGNDSTKHVLECNSITWLNNVMVLLTLCLQTLQQLRDKLALFDQISF